jgi:hypothetical protein
MQPRVNEQTHNSVVEMSGGILEKVTAGQLMAVVTGQAGILENFRPSPTYQECKQSLLAARAASSSL